MYDTLSLQTCILIFCVVAILNYFPLTFVESHNIRKKQLQHGRKRGAYDLYKCEKNLSCGKHVSTIPSNVITDYCELVQTNGINGSELLPHE